MTLLSQSLLLLRCHCSHNAAVLQASNRLFSAAAPDEQDKVILKGLSFYGYHGARPEENVLGQRFIVDATLWADTSGAGQSDQLQDTIDYTKVFSEVKQVMEGPPRALQERLAEEMCQRLLQMDTRVTAVKIYVRKPHCPVDGVLESIGVEIFRRSQATSPTP